MGLCPLLLLFYYLIVMEKIFFIRKNIPLLQFPIIFGVCIILLLIINACNKNKQDSYQIKDALTWLQKNGGNFKNQKIGLKLQNGQQSIGRLDWNKIKEYLNQGIKYIEIPFVFDNIGEKVPLDTFAAYATYHLVIRENKTTDYEGAIQITQVNTKMKNIKISQH